MGKALQCRVAEHCQWVGVPAPPCNQPNASTNQPNVSRWNVGHVGSPHVGAQVGHVDFTLFVLISFALGSRCERNFRWNMGL